MSPRKKQTLGQEILEEIICGLLETATKYPDSGLGRFVGWVFGAIVFLTLFAVVLIVVAAAAFTLYSMMNSG